MISYTLECVRRGCAGLSVETIVVDDGSSPPVAETLARLGFTPTVLIRQPNQGLLFARLAGFAAAQGKYLLFLDSDDLIAPGKLQAQIAAMEAARADVSYTDTARCDLAGDYDSLTIQTDPPTRATSDSTDFFINIQPPPHSPVFRTSYLRAIVEQAFIPPAPLYNSVAEIWFYHNAAPHPARVRHVPGPLTIVGAHPGARLTNHWEKLGVGSLAVMEAFVRHCPDTSAAAAARRAVGEKAFASWRRLPRHFSPEFGERLLAVWRRLATPPAIERLGGPLFRTLAAVAGAERAARILQLRNAPYDSCRTMTESEVTALLASLPAP